MKKFKFRLQKLLNLEEQRERQEKIKLQSIVSKRNGEEIMLESLRETLYRNQKELAGEKGGKTDAQHLMLTQNYIVAINERIDNQKTIIDETNKKIDICMLELLELQKNRKIVEKLRDNKEEEYIVDLRKKEGNEVDDISMGRRFFMSKC